MQNPYLSYASARLACMFYFMAPGLAYGLVTSRMPALKNMTGATEGELGIILLCFGLSALIGLAFAPRLIAKISAKTTLLASSLACMVFVVLVSFSSSVWFFGIAMALLGICMGLCDVTMNVQGVEVERAYKKSSMNILHAGYNIGAAAAACAGSIFAATNFDVWVNFVLPVAIMAGMLWWAEPRLVTENLEKPERSESSPLVSVEPKKRLPFLVWVCGLLCVCCYVSEGSVGEWGSLYLHQEKAAPESIAALVFAGFSICSLLCRLVADRLRNNFGDFLVSTAGATLALAGMLTVLSSSSWSICLIGYAMMGLGQAPIVPIAFSRAGAIKGVSTARATSLVSLLAYAGLLFAPPRLRPFCRTLRAAHRPLRRTGSSDDYGFASFPARASYQTLSRRHPSGRILTSSKRPSIIVATTGHALDFGASKLRRRLSWPLLNPQAGMLFSSSPSLGSFPATNGSPPRKSNRRLKN